jgi:hypothetical protein
MYDAGRGCLSASRLLPGPEAGEGLHGAATGRLLGACLTGCTPYDAPVTWRRGLTLVRAASGATTGASGGDGSGTARKYSNSPGRGWTCRDVEGR